MEKDEIRQMWKEFFDSGLFSISNNMLKDFGWKMETNWDGDVYPVRLNSVSLDVRRYIADSNKFANRTNAVERDIDDYNHRVAIINSRVEKWRTQYSTFYSNQVLSTQNLNADNLDSLSKSVEIFFNLYSNLKSESDNMTREYLLEDINKKIKEFGYDFKFEI